MKKFLMVVAAALLMTVSANARMFVGGSAGFSVNNGHFSGQIAPEFGYKFNESIAVGGYVAFAGYSGYFTWNVSPYFRWTFVHVNDFGIFGEASFGIGTTKYGEDTSVTKWNILVIPGVSYNISDRWSIIGRVGSIGYQSEGKSGDLALNLNFSPTIGVAFTW